MAVIGVDLGGTKLASAVFHSDGTMIHKETAALKKRQGKDVGALITGQIQKLLVRSEDNITSIGVSVPGISYANSGTVWAPNIPGWEKYPLLEEIKSIQSSKEILVEIDSDRACYILGETWQGAAKGCKNVIFMAVGTGIGTGIMIDGRILRGSNDIAGCIGWMALDRPWKPEYKNCGCFEYHASGEGIAKYARKLLAEDAHYDGLLRKKEAADVISQDVFDAYTTEDPIAVAVLHECIQFWGMAVANLVSLFNPEMIILGGGIFGPATQFTEQIYIESLKWAQPIGIQQVTLKASALGDDAGLIGAGRLALINQ